MPAKPNPQYVEFLYQALRTPLGLTIHTSDPTTLRTRLYIERKRNPDFQPLSFVISPRSPEKELWIVKNLRDTDNVKEED